MYYTEPALTLLSQPVFTEPAHLPVSWLGESTDGERLAEFAGRLCYMSQRNPAGRSTRDYLDNIKRQGHGSVLEHANYSVLVEGVSRSLTHELVRHRAGMAYSQLSQRYVDESEANFVVPPAIIGDAALEQAWRARSRGRRRATWRSWTSSWRATGGWPTRSTGARWRARRRAACSRTRPRPRSWSPATPARGARCSSCAGRRGPSSRSAGGPWRRSDSSPTAAPAFFSDFEVYTGEDRREAARVGYRKV
jgi:thymidylate synthase (FAD)